MVFFSFCKDGKTEKKQKTRTQEEANNTSTPASSSNTKSLQDHFKKHHKDSHVHFDEQSVSFKLGKEHHEYPNTKTIAPEHIETHVRFDNQDVEKVEHKVHKDYSKAETHFVPHHEFDDDGNVIHAS